MRELVKTFPFVLKEVDPEEGTFEGYASVFGNVDEQKEVVAPGAFKRTIKNNSDQVAIYLSHQHDMPVGKPLSLEEDTHGLLVKGQLSKTARGLDTLTLMRDGVIRGLSIGGRVIKDVYDRAADVTVLKEIALFDVSLTALPANPLARVMTVKSVHLEAGTYSLDDFQALLKGADPETSTLPDDGLATPRADPHLLHSAAQGLKALDETNKRLKEVSGA